jgi:hypothetical protein
MPVPHATKQRRALVKAARQLVARNRELREAVRKLISDSRDAIARIRHERSQRAWPQAQFKPGRAVPASSRWR